MKAIIHVRVKVKNVYFSNKTILKRKGQKSRKFLIEEKTAYGWNSRRLVDVKGIEMQLPRG